MIDIRAELAAHPFLAGVERRLIDEIVPLTTVAEFAPGEWIARAGAPAEQLLLMLTGRAGVEIAAADTSPLVVATVHPGDPLGWSWFVEPHRWHFDVVALDGVQALAIDGPALRTACATDHELGFHVAARLARVIAARLEATRHQLVDVYGRGR